MSEFRFTAWPTDFHVITQQFGKNPQMYKRFNLAGHEGVDLRAHRNTDIYAVADGVVAATYSVLSHPYGLHVRINHADDYQTIYAHLNRIDVAIGQAVKAGDVLGLAGSTGNSTAPHLHLTLKRKGAQTPGYPAGIVDPWPFLAPLLEAHYASME